MRLTNYNFDFAIYVKSLNSITSVARLSHSDFAMVFTSGITPYISMEASGPRKSSYKTMDLASITSPFRQKRSRRQQRL